MLIEEIKGKRKLALKAENVVHDGLGGYGQDHEGGKPEVDSVRNATEAVRRNVAEKMLNEEPTFEELCRAIIATITQKQNNETATEEPKDENMKRKVYRLDISRIKRNPRLGRSVSKR